MRKRIKRHVRGPSHVFFIAVAPHLTPLCHAELMALGLPLENVQVVPGGIEMTGRLPVCYQANLHLRTANRILMRLHHFSATNFRQLHKKIAAFPWELYVSKTAPLDFRVSTKHSRLYHTGAISDAVRDAIVKRLAEQQTLLKPTPTDDLPQHIFLRAKDDRFSVSIDSSGDNLYKRGVKTHGGAAPLRETLASAVLHWAGYDGSQILFDPLCGTGTFTLEAAMQAAHIPAGWYRRFAFMGWPAFSDPQWSFLKNQASENIRKVENPIIFSSDQDPALCAALARSIESIDLGQMISLQCRDFFDLDPPKALKQAGLVVLNPPYGRRLGTDQEGRQRLGAIATKLTTDFKGWRLALLMPQQRWLKTLPFPVETRPLQHGGLRLHLALGTI